MDANSDPNTQWVGLDLYDLGGDKIGTVEDVRYGDASGGLQWLVVDTGSAAAKKVFVPIQEVRRSGDRLSAIHTKQRVTDAPRVEDEKALTAAEEGKLCRYYGLQYGGAVSQPGDGCEEIPDQRPGG
jgi:sporulation protein YlmC with PRC-barrel domain